jgi:hypothetical protein
MPNAGWGMLQLTANAEYLHLLIIILAAFR